MPLLHTATPATIAMLVVMLVMRHHRGMMCMYVSVWPNNDVMSCVILSWHILVRNYIISCTRNILPASCKFYRPSVTIFTYYHPYSFNLQYTVFHNTVLHCCIADAPSTNASAGANSHGDGATASEGGRHKEPTSMRLSFFLRPLTRWLPSITNSIASD